MVPTESEILGVLQVIMTVALLTKELTTREILVTNLTLNPIFHAVNNEKISESLRVMQVYRVCHQQLGWKCKGVEGAR